MVPTKAANYEDLINRITNDVLIGIREDDLDFLVNNGYLIPIKTSKEFMEYLQYPGSDCPSKECKENVKSSLEYFRKGARAYFNALKARSPASEQCNYAHIILIPPKKCD